MTDEIECNGCGKAFPAEEVKYIEIKGCCSATQVPLCGKCFDLQKSKMQ